MLRSMYSGISGMRNFQTKLDVIGNNIANVGTTGFKKGRTTFQDMLSQTTSGAQAATDTRGGINPSQVGLGSQLGSIDNIHTQGFRQTTNNPLDFALEGDGMFIVRDGDLEAYTRAGNFYLDEFGRIVNSDGYYLVGFQATEELGTRIRTDHIVLTLNENRGVHEVIIENEVVAFDPVDVEENELTIETGEGQLISLTFDEDGNVSSVRIDEEEVEYQENSTYIPNIELANQGTLVIPENAQSFSVQANGIVNYIDEFGNPRTAGQIALANFSNPAGLEKAGNNLFYESPNSGEAQIVEPGTEGVASIISGSLEMSNVDLAEEFTEMIAAQRGFQANTRIITTSDEILQELVNLKR